MQMMEGKSPALYLLHQSTNDPRPSEAPILGRFCCSSEFWGGEGRGPGEEIEVRRSWGGEEAGERGRALEGEVKGFVTDSLRKAALGLDNSDDKGYLARRV